ncbi:bifunctional nicotinamide-nucleotide adenylyltransferase/Nudix hydroxylase [Uliginosibacterium sp. 31-16]|uniref:bifunctional nicotinamide-nucleotide adenylyltransferase/Nudix hydroxylase n=1 Tax=Uliginosibacterium sp. 31-16 TaxID=3068315 RepID=UPI00273D22FA|nr:bifunctional nicotinamide-nucleotide adenylyltransferase/Nudix hydroxylase [Uliginosibacterium sp. 31-16]MDP5240460.1 bifunctional nicotinamide-nucleotide adenylyltransferase/Nudix hydroxylase [Uliginosibacterium sp. 31-16]
MNTPQKHEVAVLIGRFQPFHNGHAMLLAKALETAPQVVVLLGSAFSARNAKNPFSWEERAAMIACTLDEAQRARVAFLPMRDCYDDARWAEQAGDLVRGLAGEGARVALIGHVKDASSQYLNRFPDWTFIAVPQQGDIDASALRAIWYESEDPRVADALLAPLMPAAALHYLQGWALLPHFARLREEHLAVEESKRVWGEGPFITVDALVRASDQILLIRRGRAPGKGQWALPGGFLDGRERVLQGAIRELREETGFALLDATLEEALVGTAVFDHPDRSSRGRTITHAHFFDLKNARPPQVAGADDAAEARWVPVAELAAMEGELFEDHFNILNHFLGLTR